MNNRYLLMKNRCLILNYQYLLTNNRCMFMNNSGKKGLHAVRTPGNIRDLQIRLRLRVRVRVFQCVPGAHARLREAVTSTRSVVKISSPS